MTKKKKCWECKENPIDEWTEDIIGVGMCNECASNMVSNWREEKEKYDNKNKNTITCKKQQ